MRLTTALLAAIGATPIEAQSSVPVITVVVSRSCGVIVGSPSILSPSTDFAANTGSAATESVNSNETSYGTGVSNTNLAFEDSIDTISQSFAPSSGSASLVRQSINDF